MESCRQMSALKVKASEGAKEEEPARVPHSPTQDSGREVRPRPQPCPSPSATRAPKEQDSLGPPFKDKLLKSSCNCTG